MFRFTLIALSLTLVACGGGGGSSGTTSPGTTKPAAIITNTDDSLTITGDSQAQTVNKTKSATVTITGDSNVIVIKSNISTLLISGNSNSIDLAAGVVISSCTVTGDLNKATKVDTTPIICTVTGKSNTGFN